MLTSIIYPSTCCWDDSAACWSAANMGFCFSWSVLEYERERGCGRQALWKWLSVLPEDLLVYVLVQQPPTLFSWVLCRKGLCSAKGCYSFLCRDHYNRTMSSCAFSLPGGAYKTNVIFWIQLAVLGFQWCISIVQEFIYLFIYPFIHNPNVLLPYCSKNCQSDKNALNIKDLGRSNENSLDYSVPLVMFVLFQTWLPTFTAATVFICAVIMPQMIANSLEVCAPCPWLLLLWVGWFLCSAGLYQRYFSAIKTPTFSPLLFILALQFLPSPVHGEG